MNVVVNEEIKAYIDPLTPDEYRSLERSVLAEDSETTREALARAARRSSNHMQLREQLARLQR